jgi:hypothetical protein
VKLIDNLRRRVRPDAEPPSDAAHATRLEPVQRNVPDPALVPTARGSWEQAALTNVDITEVVKAQINAQTPPWKK